MTTAPVRIDITVRRAFSSCSTGSALSRQTSYYETLGRAVDAFDDALRDYGLCLDCYELYAVTGDDGRAIVSVCSDNVPFSSASRAVFLWHRMPTGRYEVIGYLV